jgi:serine/threonine protein kinase
VIGIGGMSVVFGATHNLTHKRVAIKRLVAEPGVSSEDSAKRFMREARLAGHFQHPNVVQIYDFGESDGSFFMVMEWLDGESLAARLERDKQLSFAKVCELMIPCMRAMQRAHSAGIIHRDLKPANIFLCTGTEDRPEHVKVLDFGISKLLTPSAHLGSLVTKSGMVIGTPHYLSPEQLRARAIDARTDIYGFGVILYQTLSGQLPFPADNFGDLAVQIATGAPVPLRSLVASVPDGVEELVTRAMAREPADRFQDMAELIAALEELARRASLPPKIRKQLELSHRPHASTAPATSQPPAPPKPSASARVGKWPFVLLAIATLVAATALLLSYLYFDRSENNQHDLADAPLATPADPKAPALAQDVAAVTESETPVLGAGPETQPETPPATAQALPAAAPTDQTSSAAATPKPAATQPIRAAPETPAAAPPTPRPKPQSQRPPEMNTTSTPPKPSAAPVPAVEPAAPDHNPLHMTIQ